MLLPHCNSVEFSVLNAHQKCLNVENLQSQNGKYYAAIVYYSHFSLPFFWLIFYYFTLYIVFFPPVSLKTHYIFYKNILYIRLNYTFQHFQHTFQQMW